MKTYDVYNLVFPDYVDEMEIFGYKFNRVKNYPEELQKLQHRYPGSIKEFKIVACSGTNAITTKVIVPENEEDSVLPWESPKKAIHDILLLLSLLTLREVFLDEPGNGICVANPNIFEFGNVLEACIPTKKNIKNGRKIRDIEKTTNDIYSQIRNDEWLQKYGNGFFLLLLKSALGIYLLESKFLFCWTIWEHLFYLLNKGWLKDDEIHKFKNSSKISYVFDYYQFLNNINCDWPKAAEIFNKTRMRLVHSGKFDEPKKDTKNHNKNPILYYYKCFDSLPDEESSNAVHKNDKSKDDAIMFVYLTELLAAKILGLEFKDICNVLSNLKKRLNEKSK